MGGSDDNNDDTKESPVATKKDKKNKNWNKVDLKDFYTPPPPGKGEHHNLERQSGKGKGDFKGKGGGKGMKGGKDDYQNQQTGFQRNNSKNNNRKGGKNDEQLPPMQKGGHDNSNMDQSMNNNQQGNFAPQQISQQFNNQPPQDMNFQ